MVNAQPDLIEKLCADEGAECECPTGNNILYGTIDDEGKMDYMLGFSENVALADKTTCNNKNFGDPTPGQKTENFCWCQTWAVE